MSTENGCEVIAAKLSQVGDIAVIEDAICFRTTVAGSYPKGTPVYPSANNVVDRASIPTEERIVGVLMEDSTAGQLAWVGFGGVVTLRVAGPPISVGSFLFMGPLPGIADEAPFPFPGVFAIATTAWPGGPPGTILAALKASEVF